MLLLAESGRLGKVTSTTTRDEGPV